MLYLVVFFIVRSAYGACTSINLRRERIWSKHVSSSCRFESLKIANAGRTSYNWREGFGFTFRDGIGLAKGTNGTADSREPWKAFEVRQRSKGVKIDAVLATAARLFLEHGYQKTTMSMLAARLQVTKPALYYYFPNKEEILVECYRVGILEIESFLRNPGETAGTGLDRLRRYIRSYTTAVLTFDFGRCVATIDDAELSENTKLGVRELKRQIDYSLRTLTEESIADGSMSHCNSKLLSFAVSGAINWAGTWYRPDGALTAHEIAEEFARILTGGVVPAKP